MEQATRAVSSWARERIGRLALRDSVMAIEVALDIAPGNHTAAIPEKAADVVPGVWDMWNGSGNRSAMPSSPPYKRAGGVVGWMKGREGNRRSLLLFALFHLDR